MNMFTGKLLCFRTVFLALCLVNCGAAAAPTVQTTDHKTSPAGHRLSDGASARHAVITGVIASLKAYYAPLEVVQKVVGTLQAHEAGGDDDAAPDDAAFARLLTTQIRAIAHDGGLEVVYSPNILPDGPRRPSAAQLARYEEALRQQHCTFEEVKVLPGNIGYLKLNSFPDPSICGETARSAMASLNNVNAIIFDLRENRGGFPDMVMLLAAYLFDHPEYMYNPREATSQRSWTKSPVPGNKLADKPVFVLTAATTYSAAEHFSYDLKMLKRATLVGERTAGATDVGVLHRITPHFAIGIPEKRSINPFSTPNWAGTGVAPDVKVKAEDALETSERLAAKESRRQ